ncbi:MAG: BrnT family toxin [Candidatus Kapabacteria bacterium]|nr:BrnT family toxin [Candidatus Kapabacteria bacterium]
MKISTKSKIEFDWNDEKAIYNYNKHKVSFEEAMTVWDDEFAAFIHDSFHSEKEERFLLIGYSIKNNLLFVSFTERNDKIRLISSRKATKFERKRHEESRNKY